MKRLLANKNALITGGNQGLGLVIARKYIEAGASIAICARDANRLRQAEEQLRPLISPEQSLIAHPADVANVADVKAMVTAVIGQLGRIDILVNNAGIYGPMGNIEDVDWQEWMRAIEVNLCGSVLMCRAVLPHFRSSRKGGKIVQLSGGGAAKPLPRFSAYAVSKAAIVRFVETLSEEVKQDKIQVNAIAPGALNTRMLDEVLAAGPEKVGHTFYTQSLNQSKTGGVPLQTGAELAVFLGSSLSDGITGKLISAPWDPWPSLPEHLHELNNSDIYTLRRIVPKDRGKTWGNDL
jgi:NAD(P)-dependent dehydrogenase (short-subunit alcohol dehydrogenase family)